MQINRNNYEMFFLDFWEDSLTEELREHLAWFLELNPDLQDEFLDFKNCVSVKVNPDNHTEFPNKNSLKKPEINFTKRINEANYEDQIIAFLEGDLSQIENIEFNEFKRRNPQVLKDIDLYKKTFLKSDKSITYSYKARLKRNFLPFVLQRFYIYGASIAAILFLSMLLFFPFNSNNFEGEAKLIISDDVVPQKPLPPKAEKIKSLVTDQINNTDRVLVAMNDSPEVTLTEIASDAEPVNKEDEYFTLTEKSNPANEVVDMVYPLNPQQNLAAPFDEDINKLQITLRSEISEVFDDMILRDALRAEKEGSVNKNAFERVLANLRRQILGSGDMENPDASFLGQVAELSRERISELTEDSPRLQTIEENGTKQTYFSINDNLNFRISKGNRSGKPKE